MSFWSFIAETDEKDDILDIVADLDLKRREPAEKAHCADRHRHVPTGTWDPKATEAGPPFSLF